MAGLSFTTVVHSQTRKVDPEREREAAHDERTTTVQTVIYLQMSKERRNKQAEAVSSQSR